MVLTELDKLVISKQLSLEAFGYYSLAWSIAASLYLVSSPVFSAFFPLLTRYAAAGATQELAASYHRAAQMISSLVFPAAITFIFFARQLIYAWTGRPRPRLNMANGLTADCRYRVQLRRQHSVRIATRLRLDQPGVLDQPDICLCHYSPPADTYRPLRRTRAPHLYG